MKLNDFKAGSLKDNDGNLRHRLGRNSTIRFTNETKEAAYQSEINELTQKAIRVDKLSSELETSKIQRSEAVAVKNKAEEAFTVLSSKFKILQASFQEYENREPRIKHIIEQHRELNGQVAELQSKLQLVIEQHDQKVDLVNEKIDQMTELKKALHSAEISDTKAQQAKLEAVMEKDVFEERLKDAQTKTNEISIIYQEEKDKLSVARHERNVFEALKNNAEGERDKAVSLAQRLQIWGEKMETQISSSNSTTKSLQQENTELKAGTKEMVLEIKDLTDELLFISKLNKEMLKELKKPRHASIAAISKKEGFKFPTSFEARDNTLGTGKPTLLRKKE
jgi:hypothetical protein